MAWTCEDGGLVGPIEWDININISSNRTALQDKSNAYALQLNQVSINIIIVMATNVIRMNSFLSSSVDHSSQFYASSI